MSRTPSWQRAQVTLREVRCSDGGVRILVRLDGMNAVAIGADRGLAIAASDRLAVNALHEFLLHGLVTLGASGGHVEA